ncbi:MAG TPA: phosphoribosylamine--glycine ligase, partial [Massilia sp.]|nr:phosphoribosylamine--glycine ligase [Massilia sp.]
PETQPIMSRLKSDYVTVLEHACNGTLDAVELEWDRRTAVGVVMAAAGYPDSPRKGDVIDDIPAETAECITFHAGTTLADGVLKTNGGRVLCVVGLGDSVKMAQKQAYDVVDRIRFDGAQFRRDIGWRGIK